MTAEVMTCWVWFECLHCKLKIAVTFADYESGKNKGKPCPKCARTGWDTSNIREATYSISAKYGERPPKLGTKTTTDA